jgi:hypothetical protein
MLSTTKMLLQMHCQSCLRNVSFLQSAYKSVLILFQAEFWAPIGEAMASAICSINPEIQRVHWHHSKTFVHGAYPNGVPSDAFGHQHTNCSDNYMPLPAHHHSLLHNLDLLTSGNREVSFHGIQCLFKLSHFGKPDMNAILLVDLFSMPAIAQQIQPQFLQNFISLLQCSTWKIPEAGKRAVLKVSEQCEISGICL